MSDEPTRIACDIDLDAPGKRFGRLRVPWSRDESAWGSLLVPVVVIAGEPGPTAVLTAGAHGDEYEGPMVLGELARRLDPADVTGRMVVLPAMNVEGLRRARRLVPADGRNLNRCYPGRADGSASEALAHFVSTRLLPSAALVLDMHSGGRSLEFVPCAIRHHLADAEQATRTHAALDAFAAPTSLVLTELDAEGMLDTLVERTGKVFVTTELGGGAAVGQAARRVGADGVWRLLAHAGLLAADHPEVAAARERVPTERRVLEVLDDGFVIAPEGGTFEPLVEPGEEVEAGELLARLHHLDRPELPPRELTAPTAGVLVARRAVARTEPGDCLAVLGGPWEGVVR